MDYFWPGMLAIEMKSSCKKNLTAAKAQLDEYVAALPNNTDPDLPPRLRMVCNFNHFEVYELRAGVESKIADFKREDLVDEKILQLFASTLTHQPNSIAEKIKRSLTAAEAIGALYKNLIASGEHDEDDIQLYVTRLLYCFYADEFNVFSTNRIFRSYVASSAPDGSKLASDLRELFKVLNTPKNERPSNLPTRLATFPYINGGLFERTLEHIDYFDVNIYRSILASSTVAWDRVTPDIFGTFFQNAMSREQRKELGAFYTSEENILRVIEPLFLWEYKDELTAISEAIGNATSDDERGLIDGRLIKLHDTIASKRFLDPACGSGNFLLVTYRELRLLELEIIKQRQRIRKDMRVLNHLTIGQHLRVALTQFFGIEYLQIAGRIAQVAMWAMAHYMDDEVCAQLDIEPPFKNIPLPDSAIIKHGEIQGNALRMDWTTLADSGGKVTIDYIFGNPPFSDVWETWTDEQREDILYCFTDDNGELITDESKRDNRNYASAWLYKAADYMQKQLHTECAFILIAGVCSGRQATSVWKPLMNHYGLFITFAYKSFEWNNNANTSVVICGISASTQRATHIKCRLWKGDGTVAPMPVNLINNRLNSRLGGFIGKQVKHIQSYVEHAYRMKKGNKHASGAQGLLIDDATKVVIEKELLLLSIPSKIAIRKYVDCTEILNGVVKHCLWLTIRDKPLWSQSNTIADRLIAIDAFRSKSPNYDEPSYRFERIPYKGSIRYIAIPAILTSTKKLLASMPFTIFDTDTIPAEDVYTITCELPESDIDFYYRFGLFVSKLHYLWFLEYKGIHSTFNKDRYGAQEVYNTFPWIWYTATPAQKSAVHAKVLEILAERQRLGNALGKLYDKDNFPNSGTLPALHAELDELMYDIYGCTGLTDDEVSDRLYDLYAQAVAGARL
jgi:hypothetical protein